MSKPRVTARAMRDPVEKRVLCQPEPVYRTPGAIVDVDFDHGDHERALLLLGALVEEVKRQIAESHAPTWDGPRQEGEE